MSLLGVHKTIKADRLPGQTFRAYSFLKDHAAGVLATVDPNGEPHGAVIYYGVDPSLTVMFLTKRGTKKSDNLAHHNHAMLTVFDERLQTTVQITGIVSEISNNVEISKLFRTILRASLHTGRSAVPPVTKLPGGEFIGYRLKPVQVRLSAYAHPAVRGPGKMFETIDIPL